MMGRMTELWQLGALELAGKIAGKEVSSREVVEAHLARVEQVNGSLNAVVRLLTDEALLAADHADAAVAAGGPLGRLHGVPCTREGEHRRRGHADDRRGADAGRLDRAPSTRRPSSGCGPPAPSRSPAPTCPTSGCGCTPIRRSTG